MPKRTATRSVEELETESNDSNFVESEIDAESKSNAESESDQESKSEYSSNSEIESDAASLMTQALINKLLSSDKFLHQFAKKIKRVKTNNADKYSKSVIKVSGIYKDYSYEEPYKSYSESSGTGSGFIVEYKGGIFVISNAHVVNNALNLTVRFADDSTIYNAEALLIDNDCDLSLLRIKDPVFYELVKPFKITTDHVHLLDQVTRLGFPMGGEEVCITEGSVSRIEVDSYAHSDANLLQYQIDAPQNPGNSGGPVINRKNEVIGVSFQSAWSGDALHYTIPAEVIRHVLDAFIGVECDPDKYPGFPDLAIYHQELENIATRKAVGADDSCYGVLIRYTDPLCSSNEHLKPDDILMSLDDHPIKKDGTIETEFSKRIDMSYLYTSKHIGDTIKATVIRDGETLDLIINLSYRAKTTSLVSSREYDTAPTYYIYCGVVFVPETENASDEIEMGADLGDDNNTPIKKKLGQENVLISNILHNELTFECTNLSGNSIKEVNGIKIDNLRHLIEVIETSTTEHIVITANNKCKLGLPRLPKEVSLELLKGHGIFTDRSSDLLVPKVYKPGCPEYVAQPQLEEDAKPRILIS